MDVCMTYFDSKRLNSTEKNGNECRCGSIYIYIEKGMMIYRYGMIK